MKVMRKQEVEVPDIKKIQIGDQIVIPLAKFGEFTATAQKITDKGALFMFDDCVDKQPMNMTCINDGGYTESFLKKWIDTVVLNAFPKELKGRIQNLALPTYGMMFGHDDFYKQTIEPDNDEQFPLMAKRKNRIVDCDSNYELYWLQNATKKDFSTESFAVVCRSNGDINVGYAGLVKGVRLVFWLVK